MKGITIIILLIITCFKSFAQDVEFSKDNFRDKKDELKLAKNEIELGDEIMEKEAVFYKNAIPHYLIAYKLNPNNALLNFKLGKCYYHSSFRSKCTSFFEKAYQLNPEVDPEILYYLGMGYHLDMQFDKAIQSFNAMITLFKGKDKTGIVDEMKKYIRQCEYAKVMVKNPVRVKIDNVGGDINSQYPDYSPVIMADESEMIFTSRRPETTGGGLDPFMNEPFEDMYVAVRMNNKWGKARNMGTTVNTEGHDSNCGLSADGQKFLIYKDVNHGDVFESVLTGTTWSTPEKLNKNINTDAHESSSSYTPDGNTIYFVSDKEGGLGGRDIYTSTKSLKGKWGEAVNLGSIINTPEDEEGIFVHPDGKTIYFSSKGHQTMGGYDVFKSVYNDSLKTWSKPENIGYPINTTDEDVFFSVSASGKHAYYSSVRSDGFGDKDIFRITFFGPVKSVILNTEDNLIASHNEPVKEKVKLSRIEIKEAQLTLLKGFILDDKTNKPLDATIEIIDNERNEVIASFTSNSETGRYLVSMPAGKNYGISVKKENYLFHSENFDLALTSEYQEVKKDIKLKNIAVGQSIVLKNIFFDFNKSTLRKESENEIAQLTKLLIDIPTMKIEISGHTDSYGSDVYNKNLSHQRAKAVYDRLLQNGIKADRLTFMGYGEEKPIDTNETDEGRQMNRRTEFKVTAK
jgi:outer membrane protein OmpA-like peptidoglycan-associated protein